MRTLPWLVAVLVLAVGAGSGDVLAQGRGGHQGGGQMGGGGGAHGGGGGQSWQGQGGGGRYGGHGTYGGGYGGYGYRYGGGYGGWYGGPYASFYFGAPAWWRLCVSHGYPAYYAPPAYYPYPVYASPAPTVYIQKPPVVAAAPPPAPRPAPPAFERYTLSAKELFAFDSASLREPQPKLDEIATALVRNPRISGVTIMGYTDRLGSDSYNLTSYVAGQGACT